MMHPRGRACYRYRLKAKGIDGYLQNNSYAIYCVVDRSIQRPQKITILPAEKCLRAICKSYLPKYTNQAANWYALNPHRHRGSGRFFPSCTHENKTFFGRVWSPLAEMCDTLNCFWWESGCWPGWIVPRTLNCAWCKMRSQGIHQQTHDGLWAIEISHQNSLYLVAKLSISDVCWWLPNHTILFDKRYEILKTWFNCQRWRSAVASVPTIYICHSSLTSDAKPSIITFPHPGLFPAPSPNWPRSPHLAYSPAHPRNSPAIAPARIRPPWIPSSPAKIPLFPTLDHVLHSIPHRYDTPLPGGCPPPQVTWQLLVPSLTFCPSPAVAHKN